MNIAELSDIQSESGVIGTLIYHPDFVLHSDDLLPSYFYGSENGCIYWAIQGLYRDGITNIDAYNLSNKLKTHPSVIREIEKYNMPSVQEFMEFYKETARHTLEEYKKLAGIIISFAFKRDLVRSLGKLEGEVYKKSNDLAALSSGVYDEMDNLTRRYVSSAEIETLGSEIDGIWQEICDRRTGDGLYGMLSKYPAFNEYFTYEQGELVVVQARYKRGKSILLLNETVNMLRHGVPTLVIDTEMNTRLYTERLLSHLTGIEVRRIKSGNYTAEEEYDISVQREWLKKQPFVHIYDPDITDEKMYTICKMLKYKIGLGFVVFDYIKSNETDTGDNYNVLGAKCDYLKNKIAGTLNLPVLSACQLNRVGEVADSDKINRYLSVGIKWDRKTPQMIAKDGMECGNAFAKIYVNRNGEQMSEDDEDDYVDFVFSANKMTITQAKQHHRENPF